MLGVLWGIAILLVNLWVLGKLIFGFASALIHLLLVVAVAVVYLQHNQGRGLTEDMSVEEYGRSRAVKRPPDPPCQDGHVHDPALMR